MSYFNMYVIIIFIVKILFICLAIYGLYLKAKKSKDKKKMQTVQFWKERMEFMFITLMSILMIYLFNPRTSNKAVMIDGETKLLLYLFGFVLLLTENWSNFIHESPFFKKFQSILA